MLTTEQLQAIMPALPAAKRATLFPSLTSAIAEFGIEAPARTAAFLAQLAHESAQFRFMEEIWGPTAAQRRYEPQSQLATNLGNTETGDGFRFKGRGPIQITGRANYRRFGDILGVDLVADPDRAAQPELAFRIAGAFWSRKGLNELADRATDEAFREITRRINGGFNGLAERQRFYEAARGVLGVTAPPRTRGAAPAEREAPEPEFERGFEAIRRGTRRAATRPGAKKRVRPTAKKKAVARKRAAAGAKKKGARKTVARKGARKTAARTTKRAGKSPVRKTGRQGRAKR